MWQCVNDDCFHFYIHHKDQNQCWYGNNLQKFKISDFQNWRMEKNLKLYVVTAS
jgi:hypothetical protein